MEMADYQLGVGIDSHRQVAAANATADDQRSVSGNLKSAARMRPGYEIASQQQNIGPMDQ
jgi:hypothetical protein